MIFEDNRFKFTEPSEEDYLMALELLDYLDGSGKLTDDEEKALSVVSNTLVDLSNDNSPDCGEVPHNRANIIVDLSFRKVNEKA